MCFKMNIFFVVLSYVDNKVPINQDSEISPPTFVFTV